MSGQEPMTPDQGAVLAEFARACKAAARSVSLYPRTHPAIGASLGRVTAAAARLTAGGDTTLTVHPDVLAINGRTPARPDPAVGELAMLLHERLVGQLRVEKPADSEDWHTLLLLLGRSPEELIADGGIGRVWRASGRGHFDILEIDYSEVLRERADGGQASWDRIVAFCLQDEGTTLDERGLASLIDALQDSSRFGDLLAAVQQADPGGHASIGSRAAGMLRLLRTAVDSARERGESFGEHALKTIAESTARLTPDMMLALLAQRASGDPDDATLANAVRDQMNDATVASFVARSVTVDGGATERLAQAFEALVPDHEHKGAVLDLAREQASQASGAEASQFDRLWQNAADMLQSYTDQNYVSDGYARELSGTRTRAVDVERLSTDPPERIQAWLGSVADNRLRQLDLELLTDLLRLEDDLEHWEGVSAVAVAEIERRTLLGDATSAQALADRLASQLSADPTSALHTAAAQAIQRLSHGSLISNVVARMRKADDAEVEPLTRLCQTVGPRLVQPLAEALSVEENNRASRRLRELLLAFGAAGRQSVEKLKHSSNPAVRRTAIDLLRVFGGREALPELESMLDDADPQVQRESIRAIVQIGTTEAFGVLQRPLLAGGSARDTILQQLLALREEKAIPLFCYVLMHTLPRGKLVRVHTDVIDALGGLGADAESTRALQAVLYRGDWWAPSRTAMLRRAAAGALKRQNSPESRAALEEAATQGRRGVRAAARAEIGAAARRQGERV